MQLAARTGHTECLRDLHAAGGRLGTLRCIHPACSSLVMELKREIRLKRRRRRIQILEMKPELPLEMCEMIVGFLFENV